MHELATELCRAVATTRFGPAANRRTAVTATYNQFGQGKAIYIGVPPSDFTDQAKAAAVLGRAAGVLLPAADVTRAGALARFEMFIEGEAPGSPLELRTQFPAGIGVAQAPGDATVAGGAGGSRSVPRRSDCAGGYRRVWDLKGTASS